jgi:hypothetical protein
MVAEIPVASNACAADTTFSSEEELSPPVEPQPPVLMNPNANASHSFEYRDIKLPHAASISRQQPNHRQNEPIRRLPTAAISSRRACTQLRNVYQYRPNGCNAGEIGTGTSCLRSVAEPALGWFGVTTS